MALVFLLSACVTKGRPFPSDLSWITKEVTKKDDVLLLLGRPFMVGSAGGIMTWSYGRYNYHLIGRDYVKELKIYWNDDNTVRDFSFQSSFPSDMQRAGVGEGKGKNKQTRQQHLIDKTLESVIEEITVEPHLESSDDEFTTDEPALSDDSTNQQE